MASKLSALTERSDSVYTDDKKTVSQDEFVLERVQGLTSTTLHSLASNPVTGWIAFPAACVLVLLDPKTNEQKFIESPSLRNISCCTFSDDGRFVAFGETGMKPHIAMWNLREHRECHKFVTETTVRAVFFHPNSPALISLGLKESVIMVWDYIKGVRLASCKWQTMPLSLTIPRVGSNLLVCGYRKITLFNIAKVSSRSYETNVFEDRKTVLLGKQSEYTFVDIVSGRGKHERTVYTVTSCGYLCEVKLGDILIDKAIKVDTQAFCIRYNTELIFVGCTAGVVKICDPDNLTVTAAVSLSSLLGPNAVPKVGSKGYIDVCTLVVDENEKIVTCVYADCSIHSWQIGTDGQKIVCSAIEPGTSCNDASKFNLLRSFIGCCEKTKGNLDFLTRFSLTEQNKPVIQYGGRRLVNENRVFYQNANSVRFTPDGKDVICGNEEGEIKVYDLSTGILRRVIEAHSSQVTCIELMYDKDFQLVCSGGRDRVMFVLNARADFSLVQVLCDHSAAITAISLMNNKGVLTLVSAAADNVILIRRAIMGGTLRFTITGEIAQNNCNRSFFVTSDYIALGGKDSQIKVFKADPVFVSKPMKTINCQKLSPISSGFKAIDIDPSGSFMAVSQANGNISVYHLQTGQPVASLPLQSDIINVKFTNDLKYMVSSTSNGCDLVWRLPERMTEFMRSKKEKTYQMETNKEVTYEAYVSCMKLCKTEDEHGDDDEEDGASTKKRRDRYLPEETEQNRHSGYGESPQQQGKSSPEDAQILRRGDIAQNSSNHNSEWDRTPTIDSMSILDKYSCQMMRPEKDRCMRRATGVGETRQPHSRRTGSAEDVDSYEKMQSCSSCGSDSILSCSTCTRSASTTTQTSCCSAINSDSSVSSTKGSRGHKTRGQRHQNMRYYCEADRKLFGQVVEEGKCVKVGPFKEDRKITMKMTGTGKSVSCKEATVSGYQAEYTKDIFIEAGGEGSVYNNVITNSEVNPDTEVQTCVLGENNKEEPIGSSTFEIDPVTSSTTGSKHHKITSSVIPIRPQEKTSQNSDQLGIKKATLQESRFCRSKKIMEKASFYESMIKGERRPSPTSPTRQETAAVAEAVRVAFQKRKGLNDTCAEEHESRKQNELCSNATDVTTEKHHISPYHWTPLTTPEFSNTSSNITNLVPSPCSTLDMSNTSKLVPVQEENIPGGYTASNEDEIVTCRINCKVSDTVKDLMPVSDEKEHLAERKENMLATDTTQEEGETLHSELTGGAITPSYLENDHTKLYLDKVQAKVEEEGIACNTVLDQEQNKTNSAEHQLTDSYTVYSSPLKDTTVLSECPETNPELDPSQQTMASVVDKLSYSTTYNQTELVERAMQKKTIIDHLQQKGRAVPEKYHNALRGCMQLSNSQETFATLRVDSNDTELMAFLSQTLKRKLVAAGLVTLSYSEIEDLLNTSEDWKRGEGAVTAPSTSSKASPSDLDDLTAHCSSDEHNLILGDIDNVEERCKGVNCEKFDATSTSGAINAVDHNLHTKISSSETKASKGHCKSAPNSPQKSPKGNSKIGMYRTILHRLSVARKLMSNRSANRTESGMTDEHLFDKTPNLNHLLQDGRLPVTHRGEHTNPKEHLYCHSARESRKQDLEKMEDNMIDELYGGSGNQHLDYLFNRLSALDLQIRPMISTRASLQQDNLDECYQNIVFDNIQSPDSASTGRDGRFRCNTVSDNTCMSASKQCPAPRRAVSARGDRPGTRGQNVPEPRSGTSFSRTRRAWRAHSSRSVTPTRGVEKQEASVQSRAAESLESTLSRDVYQSSESDSGVDACCSSFRDKPMAEMFRDQDEYLKKLKEVRQNFERSIQALSEERKSRQAAAAEAKK